MGKILLITLVLCFLCAANALQAQCSVTISTNTNTTQLNCTNPFITLTAHAEGTTPVSFLWSTAETSDAIVVTNPGTYEVTITATGGCTTRSNITITKDVSLPTVTILAFPEKICAGDSVTLVAIGAQSYVWDWDAPLNPTSDVVIVRPDTTTVYSVTGKGLNGCTVKVSKTIPVNQTFLAAGIYSSNFPVSSVCQNSNQAFIIIGGVNGTLPYTFGYNINNGPTQTIQTIGQENSVNFRVPTDALGAFTYNLISVSDSNNCIKRFIANPNQATVTILPVPTLISKKDSSVCNNVPFEYTAISSAPGTTISWKRDLVNGISNAAQKDTIAATIKEALHNTTSDPVVVTYYFTLSTGVGCMTHDSLKVTVNPTPAINSISDTTFCNSFQVGGLRFSSTTPNSSFKWTCSPGIGFGSAGTDSIPEFVAINNGNAQIIATVKVSIATGINNCPGPDRSFKINVLPAPVLASKKDSSICNNTQFKYTAISSASGTAFHWVRHLPPGITGSGSAASGDKAIIDDFLQNANTRADTVRYIFELSTGTGCITTETVRVIVNPTPVVISTGDTTFCNGFSVNGLHFSSLTTNSFFKWTCTPGIGFGSGGADSIPRFVATNNGTVQVNATVKVSITTGIGNCSGPDHTFKISVLPAPVLLSKKDTSVCENSTFSYTAKSSFPGTTDFSWKRDFATGIENPANSGDSSFINEMLVNETDQPKIVKYVFSLSIGQGCETIDTLFVTVNPTPSIEFIQPPPFCNGDSVRGGIIFSSKSPNAVFNWENDHPGIGLEKSGKGSIYPFIATNPGSDPITATITVFVKASSDSCSGIRKTFTITVLPGPLLTSSKLESICNDNPFTYKATSSATKTFYHFERLALPAGFTGKPPEMVNDSTFKDALNNNTNKEDTVKYAFNLAINESGGCISKDTLRVIVYPTPKITPFRDSSFCNSAFVNFGIPFKSVTSNAVFNWINEKTGIGLPASGRDSIAPFIASNATADTIGSKISVTISVNNGLCPGPDESFRVIVYPTPSLTSPKESSVCNGNTFQVTATSSAVNTAFNWVRPKVDNIIPETANGNTAEIRETLQNATINPIGIKYYFTLETGQLALIDDRMGCTTNDSLLVTVNPTPVIFPIRDTAFCNKVKVTGGISFESLTPNRIFTWSNSNTGIGLPASGTGSIPSFIATNTDTIPITAIITVNIKASSDSCAGSPRIFTITVYPSASRPNFYSLSGTVDSSELNLCSGSNNINFNVYSISPRTSYLWELESGNGSNVAIRKRNNPNTVISFTGRGTYKIRAIATNFAHGGCKDTVTQLVTVNSNPGIEERKVFLKQPGNILVYPDNLLRNYQWGTDRVLSVSPDSSFGPPIPLPNQLYQFYPAGNSLDTTNFLYWVSLDNGTCRSRVYYNGPYAARQSEVVYVNQPVELLVYPNPNQGSFDVSLKGNIYGKIEAKIYNAGGHQVFTKKFVKTAAEVYEKFNTGKLSSGIYFLELYSSDLKKVVTRFIIQH